MPGGFTGADDPRRGRGPKKGAPNAGRPPKQYVEWCKTVLSNKQTEAAVRKILRNAGHQQFSQLYGRIAERAYGRAGQADVTFPINPKDLTDEQLQRVAQGEDPILVLATSRER